VLRGGLSITTRGNPIAGLTPGSRLTSARQTEWVRHRVAVLVIECLDEPQVESGRVPNLLDDRLFSTIITCFFPGVLCNVHHSLGHPKYSSTLETVLRDFKL